MEKTLRVCHFAASPGLGRGEAYVDLANELSRLEHLRVGMLIPHDALFRQRIAATVDVIEYRGGCSRRNPLFLWEIARALRAWKPDLVHTHFAKATTVYQTLRRCVRARCVATKHNPRPGPVFEKVPHVIAVSVGVAESLRRSDVKVIYNGVIAEPRLRMARPQPAVLRCLTVGRLDPIKGFDRLIRALAASRTPWNLRIAGDGPQRGELEGLIRELGLAERVELLGFRSDVPQLLQDCDVFIQSSHSEGCSLALLEALHYAPLVISTPVGVAVEFFPDWLLWKPEMEGALAAMLQNYAALAERCDAWVGGQLPRFNLKSTAAEHATFYRTLVPGA